MGINNYYCHKSSRKTSAFTLIQFVLYGVIYAVAYVLNEEHNYISAAFLICLAVESYLFFAIRARDMIDINGVFFGTWTISIGFCLFRFSAFQRPWLASSWVDFALTPVIFYIAFHSINQLLEIKLVIPPYIHLGRYELEYKKDNNKGFIVMMLCAITSIALMIIQYKIKGFFPLFTSGMNDRIDFYTRLIVFISAIELTPPICYYLLRQEGTKGSKRVLLYLAMIVPFITALLRLSRGEYAVAMMLLIPSIYYFSKKKFLALALSCVFFVTGYYVVTSARPESKESVDYYWNARYKDEDGGYTAEQEAQEEIPVPTDKSLVELPTQGELNADDAQTRAQATDVTSVEDKQLTSEHTFASPSDGSGTPIKSETVQEQSVKETPLSNDAPGEAVVVEPPQMMSKIESFTYNYLINGFENYDFATRNAQEFSHGLRHLLPLTVVLRLDSLRDKIEALPSYTWIPGTTKCLIADFYLDFGRWAVYVGMALWGITAGIIHYIVKKWPGGISMAVYGVCFVICSLAFFNPWLSYFQMWMFWGFGLVLCLPNIKISKWQNSLQVTDEGQGE